MDVIQALAERGASVNSLSHLGVQFLWLGLRESGTYSFFFFFFFVTRTDPAYAAVYSAGAKLPLAFHIFSVQA
jgi:hypothetical protein